MYKIVFMPTGHVFELPDLTALELKEKFPEDYRIIEKNGRKFYEKKKKVIHDKEGSVYSKVVES